MPNPPSEGWMVEAMPSTASDDAHATIDRHPLAGDVFARIGGQQNTQAFEVLVVAQAVQGACAAKVSPILARVAAVSLLGKNPGQMAFTRMLWAPHSAAKARVKLITAPLEVL